MHLWKAKKGNNFGNFICKRNSKTIRIFPLIMPDVIVNDSSNCTEEEEQQNNLSKGRRQLSFPRCKFHLELKGMKKSSKSGLARIQATFNLCWDHQFSKHRSTIMKVLALPVTMKDKGRWDEQKLGFTRLEEMIYLTRHF